MICFISPLRRLSARLQVSVCFQFPADPSNLASESQPGSKPFGVQLSFVSGQLMVELLSLPEIRHEDLKFEWCHEGLYFSAQTTSRALSGSVLTAKYRFRLRPPAGLFIWVVLT